MTERTPVRAALLAMTLMGAAQAQLPSQPQVQVQQQAQPQAQLQTQRQTQQEAASLQIAAKFQALYPNTRITEVRKARVAGLYEVVMGDNVAYTDDSGRYFIFGHLFDMKEQLDLIH